MADNGNADFDEDIILPNSPLAEYVKELDCDESALFSESSKNENINAKTNKTCVEKPEKRYFSLKSLFLNEVTYWKNLLTINFLQGNLEKGNDHLNAFLKKTIKDDLLTNEDKSFVNHLLSDTLILEKGPSLLSPKLLLYSVLSFAIFCITACVGTALNNIYMIVFPTIIFVLFCISLFTYFVYCKNIGRKFENACLSLVTFPASTKRAIALIKGSGIRLIQEAELIARGFTSASVLGVAEHIELSFTLPINPSSRQYSELRKSIFNWLRTVFIDYKTLTLNLIQNIPVEKTFSTPNCLASLNIDEFGGFLNHDLDSSEISDVTDNFSIQSLKTLHYLAKMQISEFFKLISIRLYVINNKETVNCWKLIEDIHWLVLQTHHVERKMSLMFDKVYDTCKYYTSIEASLVTKKEVQSCFKTKSPKSDLKICLHNMSLHLKAALLRLIEIENQFDNSDSNQVDANSKLDMETDSDEFKKHVLNLLPLLNIAKSEVNAFDECFDKFTKNVDTLLNFEKEPESLQQSETEPEIVDKAATNVERCDVEREIQDEVFEAIVSNINNDQQESAAFMGEEARKNSELASFMLKELKNVLVYKADEHRAREQVALAKKVNVANTDNSSGTESNTAEEDPGRLYESITDKTVEISEIMENIKSTESENDQSIGETSELSDDNPPNFLNLASEKTGSFAASIAMLAAQRQKSLGLSNEEFVDGCDSSDVSDSDS